MIVALTSRSWAVMSPVNQTVLSGPQVRHVKENCFLSK